MLKKRLYMTVAEKKEYDILSKHYGITEHTLHSLMINTKQKRSITRRDTSPRNTRCKI